MFSLVLSFAPKERTLPFGSFRKEQGVVSPLLFCFFPKRREVVVNGYAPFFNPYKRRKPAVWLVTVYLH